jgi:HD-like signal output (HDOD) protein
MPDLKMTPLSEKLHLRLLQLREIPPPAGTAREVMRVTGDDQIDLKEVTGVIEKSPELTARILRCANSAYYGQRKNIQSVKEAVVRVLGLSVTKGLILAIALSRSFQLRSCPNFQSERYWFVAVTTANLSQELSRRLKVLEKPAPGMAYTAGLIHNLGILAMVQTFPEQMKQVFAQKDDNSAIRLMDELLGINHYMAGSWLAERWGLPKELVRVIAHHNDSHYRGPDWPLVNLIGLAAKIGDNLYAGQVPKGLPPSWPEGFLVTSFNVNAAVDRLTREVEQLKDLAHLLARNGE